MPRKIRILAGISCLSAQILALELVLTRFFAISQGYHYAFLVVSLAFLGFGVGSALLFLSDRLPQLRRGKILLSRLTLLLSLSVLISFYLVNLLTFNPVEVLWKPSKLGLVPVQFLFLSLPFFIGGLTIATALTIYSDIIHQVYFADLLGASLGIILSALSFRLAGDKGAIWLLSLLALLASWLFLKWAKTNLFDKFIQTGITLAVLLIISLFGDYLVFKISDYKPLPFFLKQKGAAILQTFWDEKARLDLFDSPAIKYAPGLSLKFAGQIPHQMGLSLDGEKISGLIKSPVSQDGFLFLDYLPLSIAFERVQAGHILLLKPESDLELFLSLKSQAHQVTVFEENEWLKKVHEKQVVTLASDSWKENTLITFRTVEARVGLMQAKEKNYNYDLIVYPLPDLPGSLSSD
ncbi:MAG: hypothetical protein ACPLRA_05785 [Candidatus Saccharicenans sp.]